MQNDENENEKQSTDGSLYSYPETLTLLFCRQKQQKIVRIATNFTSISKSGISN